MVHGRAAYRKPGTRRGGEDEVVGFLGFPRFEFFFPWGFWVFGGFLVFFSGFC